MYTLLISENLQAVQLAIGRCVKQARDLSVGSMVVERRGHDERHPTVKEKKEKISLRLVSYGTMYLDRRTSAMSSRKRR